MKKLLLILLAASLVAGCKKEVQGPAGPQGPQGNANVHSITWTTNNSNWFGSNSIGWETSKFWDVLTADFVEGGAVHVYQVIGEDNLALPVTVPSGNSFVFIGYSFAPYFIEIGQVPGSGITVGNPNVKTYKAVAVASRALAMGDEYVRELIKNELAK